MQDFNFVSPGTLEEACYSLAESGSRGIAAVQQAAEEMAHVL